MSFKVITNTKAAGGLGRRAASTDAVMALVMGGVVTADYATLGTIVKLIQASDADNYGWTASYDSNNEVLVRYHIDEFFRIAPNGTLYVMMVAKGTSQDAMWDSANDYVKKLMTDESLADVIKVVGTVLNPAGDNQIGSVTISSGGTGYAVNDTIAGSGGGGTGFAAKVSAVDGSGVITAITITNHGLGYATAPTLAITTSGGSTATLVAVLGYNPTMTNGIDVDVEAAIETAQDLVDTLIDDYAVYLDACIIEGRNLDGAVADFLDLRSFECPNVSVVVAADPAITALDSSYVGTAAVGTVLGSLAARKVSENLGSVVVANPNDERKSDPNFTLTDTALGYWEGAELSDGTNFNDLTPTEKETLTTLGYIYVGKFPGYAGYFFNDSHTCVAVSDDYAYIELNRAWNKAVRAIRQVMIPLVRSEVPVDETGDIKRTTKDNWEERVKSSVNSLLADGEVSSYDFYVVAGQDVLAGDPIKTKLKLVPIGIVREIENEIGFSNS